MKIIVELRKKHGPNMPVDNICDEIMDILGHGPVYGSLWVDETEYEVVSVTPAKLTKLPTDRRS